MLLNSHKSGYPSLVWSWPAKNYICWKSVLYELGGSNPPPDVFKNARVILEASSYRRDRIE